MSATWDQLAFSDTGSGDVARDQIANPPLPLETPDQTDARQNQDAIAVQRDQLRADQQFKTQQRMTGAAFAAQGVPTYSDSTGAVQPVTDTAGKPLTNYDKKNSNAWDSLGNVQKISYDGTPGAPPVLSDPYENAPTTTDKEGNIYKVAPGLPWKFVDQDDDVIAANAQKEKDAALAKAATAIGGKLSLDQHAAVSAGVDYKAAQKQFQAVAGKAGLDPSSEAGQAVYGGLDDGDPAAAHAGIDAHFNSLYAAPEANATAGLFSSDLSPAAQQLRAGLDADKATAHTALDRMMTAQARMQGAQARLDATQQAAEAVRTQNTNARLAAAGLPTLEDQQKTGVESSAGAIPGLNSDGSTAPLAQHAPAVAAALPPAAKQVLAPVSTDAKGQVQPEGFWATVGRAFGTKIFPAVATAVGGLGAGALTIESGPGAIAADIVAGAAAGTGADKLQRAVMGDKVANDNDAQMQANAKAHPVAAQIGTIAPFLISLLGGGAGGAVKAGDKVIGSAVTSAGRQAVEDAAAIGAQAVKPTVERVASRAAQFARVGASDSAQEKYAEGKDVNVLDQTTRAAVQGGAMGLFAPAKTLLGAIMGKSVTDAAAMTLAGDIYDAGVHGKPFDLDDTAKQFAGDVPAFVIQNALLGFLHTGMAAKAGGESGGAEANGGLPGGPSPGPDGAKPAGGRTIDPNEPTGGAGGGAAATPPTPNEQLNIIDIRLSQIKNSTTPGAHDAEVEQLNAQRQAIEKQLETERQSAADARNKRLQTRQTASDLINRANAEHGDGESAIPGLTAEGQTQGEQPEAQEPPQGAKAKSSSTSSSTTATTETEPGQSGKTPDAGKGKPVATAEPDAELQKKIDDLQAQHDAAVEDAKNAKTATDAALSKASADSLAKQLATLRAALPPATSANSANSAPANAGATAIPGVSSTPTNSGGAPAPREKSELSEKSPSSKPSAETRSQEPAATTATAEAPPPPAVRPALVDEQGKVVMQGSAGDTHAGLKLAAAKQGIDATDAAHAFTDASGNVLDRVQAAKAAVKARQISPQTFKAAMARTSDRGLHSEDLKPSEGAQPATLSPAAAKGGENSAAPLSQPAKVETPTSPEPAHASEKGAQHTEPSSGGEQGGKTSSAKLPAELAGAKPRYAYGPRQFDLNFASDFDRAAYIAAQKEPSKRDADYVAFAKQASGLSEDEVRRHGMLVRAAIKGLAKNAGDEVGTLTVPKQKRKGVEPEPDITGQPKLAERPKGWRKVGVNSAGNDVEEDENGVRSHIVGNIRIAQPVSLVPTRGAGGKVEYQTRSGEPTGLFQTTEETNPKNEDQGHPEKAPAADEAGGETGARQPQKPAATEPGGKGGAATRPEQPAHEFTRQEVEQARKAAFHPISRTLSELNVTVRDRRVDLSKRDAVVDPVLPGGVGIHAEDFALLEDPKRLAEIMSGIEAAGGDPVAWLHRAYAEEEAHLLDLVLSGNRFGKDHLEWFKNAPEKIQKLVQSAYPDSDKKAELGLELVRMLDQITRFGDITESYIPGRPADELIAALRAWELPEPLAAHVAKMQTMRADVPGNISWAPELKGVGEREYSRNGLRFTTHAAAEKSARDVFSRWMGAEAWRVRPCGDVPNRDADGNEIVATPAPAKPDIREHSPKPEAKPKAVTKTAKAVTKPAPALDADAQAAKDALGDLLDASNPLIGTSSPIAMFDATTPPDKRDALNKLAAKFLDEGRVTTPEALARTLAQLGPKAMQYSQNIWRRMQNEGAQGDDRPAWANLYAALAKPEEEPMLPEDEHTDTTAGTDAEPGNPPVSGGTHSGEHGGNRPGTRGGAGGSGKTQGDTEPAGDSDVSDGIRAPGQRDGEEAGAGDRDEPVGDAADERRNLRLELSDRIGEGGLAKKFRDNVAAIETLRAVEADQREATPEEQKILARYVGWGGLAEKAFQTGGEFYDRMQALGLNDDEMASARRSTTNAHYTAPELVEGIWKALAKMGFNGGKITEPSMGSGNFFGFMPQETADASRLTGIEMDNLTARIARALYPEAKVWNRPFEKHVMADDSQDLIISNFPFSNADHPNDLRYNQINPNLHDYFFLKSLDKVRPGGFVVAITSIGTMDKLGAKVREVLSAKANLVAAFRLPDTMFKGVASTEVTTDLIILQKRGVGVPTAHEDWLNPVMYQVRTGNEVRINQYFRDHPENMLGVMTSEGTMYGGDQDLDANGNPIGGKTLKSDGRSVAELVKAISDALPKGIYITPDAQQQLIQSADELEFDPNEEKDGCFVMDGKGSVKIFRGGALERPRKEITPTSKRAKLLEGYHKSGHIRIEDGEVTPTGRSWPHTDDKTEQKLREEIEAGGISGEVYKEFRQEEEPYTDLFGQPAVWMIEREVQIYAFDGDYTKADYERIKQLIPIRRAMKAVLHAQVVEADDAALAAAQVPLNTLYDTYIKENGYMDEGKTRSAFSEDPFYPALLALEERDSHTNTVNKTDIFSKRTRPRKVPLTELTGTAREGMLRVMAQTGRVDIELQAQLSLRDPDELAAELEKEGLIFRDATTGNYVESEEYLSGNIYEKLKAAKAAVETEPGFQRNIDELTKVIPEPRPAERIQFALGAAWIDPFTYQQFIAHLFRDESMRAKVEYKDGRWSVDVPGKIQRAEGFTTDRVNTQELIEQAMNLKAPTVRDPLDNGGSVPNLEQTELARMAQDRVKAEFQNWILDKPDIHTPLVAKFNEQFNAIRPREYTAPYTTLEGMNPDITLRPHQLNAVWRACVDGKEVMAHVVGAGKTFAFMGAGMEWKRLGMASKPMYLVPNHLLRSGQTAADFYRMYPTAKILTVTKRDFVAKRRQRLMARIATGNWDAVLIGHSQIGLIPVSPDLMAAHIQGELEELEEVLTSARGDSNADTRQGKKRIKELEAQLAAKRSQMEKLLDPRRADKAIYFEELGVDALIIDEAHEFKNLNFWTKLQNVGGLGSAGTDTQKTAQLKVKTDYILRQNNGRNLIFATGTPVSNTIAEVYLLQKYLAQDLLDAAGIRYFDEWAATFANVEEVAEISPDGQTMQNKTKFSSFKNMQSLIPMFRRYVDIQRQEQLKLPIPDLVGGQIQNMVFAPTPYVVAYMAEIVERAEALKTGRVDPKIDNWLKLNTDARKVSTDPRLMDASQPDEDNYKSSQVAINAYKVWKANDYRKGTQVIFCDLYSHKVDRVRLDAWGNPVTYKARHPKHGQPVVDSVEIFNVFTAMKDRLIRMGVPEEQIALINDYEKDEDKEQLKADMNAGRVRFLLGTRMKMGTGMNIQRRMVAVWNVDAPYRPDQITQGEGRGIRQGNLFHEAVMGGKKAKARLAYQPNLTADPLVEVPNEDKVKVTPGGRFGAFQLLVVRAAVERSLDSRMFQTLTTKMRSIEDIMNGDFEGDVTEDIGEVVLRGQEMIAAASGNPLIMERFTLENAVRQLEFAERDHDRRQSRIRREVGELKESIEEKEKIIPKVEAVRADYEKAESAVDARKRELTEAKVKELEEAAPYDEAKPIVQKVNVMKEGTKTVVERTDDHPMTLEEAIALPDYEKTKNNPGGELAISAFGLRGRVVRKTSRIDENTVQHQYVFNFTGYSGNGGLIARSVNDSAPQLLSDALQRMKEMRDWIIAGEARNKIEEPADADLDGEHYDAFPPAQAALQKRLDDLQKDQRLALKIYGVEIEVLKSEKRALTDEEKKTADETGLVPMLYHSSVVPLSNSGAVYRPTVASNAREVLRNVVAALSFTPSRSRLEDDVDTEKKQLVMKQDAISGPFPEAEKLAQKRARLAEIVALTTQQTGNTPPHHGQNPPGTVRASNPLRFANATLTPPGLVFIGASNPLRAFHGTPHEVDKFSLEKVGTGEGAQAYGWGLYFAEKQDVAEEYRKNLSQADSSGILVDGKGAYDSMRFSPSALMRDSYRRLIAYKGDVDAAIRDTASDGARPDADVHEVLKKWKVERVIEKDTRIGNTYTVHLDADPDELLDWDKPLSEQSAKVRAQFAAWIKRNPKDGDWFGGMADEKMTAQELYHSLVEDEGEPAQASKFLRAIGIPGIRYLDQGSRNQPGDLTVEKIREGVFLVVSQRDGSEFGEFKTSGAAHDFIDEKEAAIRTYNYVLFDDSKIKITAKNGQPVSLPSVIGASNPLKYLKEAVTPGLDLFNSTRQGVQSLILPSMNSPEHLKAAETLGSKLGPMNRRQESARALFKNDWLTFEKAGVQREDMPLDKNPGVKFMSDMSTGRAMSPEMQAIATKMDAQDALRLDELRKADAALQSVRENYFPGVWTEDSRRAFNLAMEEAHKAGIIPAGQDVNDATPQQKAWVKQRVDEALREGEGSDNDALAYITRRPFKGKESFRKQKLFDEDILTAFEFGLRPVSYNPVDIKMLKWAEMDRNIMANQAIQDWKAQGKLKVIDPYEKVPDGWQKINDKYGTIYGPPTMPEREYVDKGIYDSLMATAKALGLDMERVFNAGRGKLGYAQHPGGKTVSQFATELSVMAHEIGHQLDFRYDLWKKIVLDAVGHGKRGKPTKEASAAQRAKIQRELRALADLSWEGQKNVSDYFKEQVRKRAEKMAHLLETFAHAPERMKEVAPTVYASFMDFLRSTPELKDLVGMKSGISLQRLDSERYVGLPIKGYRIVPDAVADVLNNYLSSSIYNNRFFGRLYTAWMGLANALNQTQLGVSAFHAGFTTMEAQISALAGVIQDVFGLARGNRSLKQLGASIGHAATATVTTPSTGDQVLNAWRNPDGTIDPRIAQVVRAIQLAGGGFTMERGMQTDQMHKTVSDYYGGKWARAALRSPVAALEATAWPIMSYLVPRQKAGVFAQMAWRIIEQNPGRPLEELTAEFRQAWNRVDARLGQVRYDRLFMHNIAKNLVQGTVRAPGWSGGTIAELGGGFKDIATFFVRWKKGGSGPPGGPPGQPPNGPDDASYNAPGEMPKELPPRAAYALALLLAVFTANALLTWLFTGEHPHDLDYWAFRTGGKDEHGRAERFVLPTYMKDLLAYAKEPLTTLAAKSHPLLSLIRDLWVNKDYYGVKIRNEDDGALKQAYDIGKYFAKAFEPFWIRGAMRERERNAGPLRTALPMIGVMPAPKKMTQTPAEKLADDYMAQQQPAGGRTQAQADTSRAKYQLTEQARRGEAPAYAKEIAAGHITARDIPTIQARAAMPPLAYEVKKLPLDRAEAVWRAANPQERREIGAVLAAKRENAVKRAGSTFSRM